MIGGVSFADGSPRPSHPAQALLATGELDLVIDTGLPYLHAPDARRITIGQFEPEADLSLVTCGLAAGLAARVMRFDGVVLWLCDERAQAPADPAARLLAQLTGAVKERA